MGTVSQRVKQRRIEMNLSQSKLAEMVGMRQQSLHAIEAGHTKRPRLIIELAVALKCDPQWLLNGERSNAS